MSTGQKIKKRGFVMTGGGAKGLYEAGVIHAFHIAGMEFDVITGSSIGAMNSVFFAEYLYHKRQLPEATRQDPEKAVEAMDARVKAYHHAWLTMPEKQLIDDSPQAPLGKLVDDLLRFDLSLPQATELAWWWTDPARGKIPSVGVWPALLKLGKELAERLGGVGEVLRIIKDHRQDPFQEAVRTYLRRFGMERSIITGAEDGKLRDIFTQPVSPLRPEHLTGEVSASDEPGLQKYGLVDPERTLRDYAGQGIDVRLTRANYRTGRLEMSSYVTAENFMRFLQKQAWRLQKDDRDKIPLGSFRLQVPGNPKAINAGLCSGRFPGVFMPYAVADLYPEGDPDNAMLHGMLFNWLCDPEVETGLSQAFQTLQPQAGEDGPQFTRLFESWRDSQSMRDFFPRVGDTYVDGGAIDNTPSNSAVDYAREWAEQAGYSKRDVTLELFVIFLGMEPKVTADEAKDPNLYQVVKRTLDVVGVAGQTSDANTVSTINGFGKRAEELGQALKLVLESYRENLGSLNPVQQRQAEERLREKARQLKQRGYLGEEAEGILDRMAEWAEERVAQDLPLHVEEVKIYPEEMPLGTLQFTERLGYRKENAIRMLAMGCYNTLFTLLAHMEEQGQDDLDAQDQQVLSLVRKWMAVNEWPEEAEERERLRQNWRCQRTACVFHAQHCPHGAGVRARMRTA